MADFTALKIAIQNAIKQNGNEEITGNLLQEVLLAIVTTLGDGSINELITALGTEATNREQADGTLQQNINAEANARSQVDIALGGRIDGVVSSIEAINDAIENGYVYAGIATPSSTPASGKVFYLALTAGTYTNFGDIAVTQGINILKYNGSAWSLDAFVGIDDTPTPSSNNLVKSGGILDSIIKDGSAFDLSAYNGGATYADLNAALTALNALPAAYKRGGMSVKFVQSSDNKYVQARLMANSFTTDVTKWQMVDTEPTANSKNLVESGGIYSKFEEQETETSVKLNFIYHNNNISVEGRGSQYDIPKMKDIPAEVGKIYTFALGSIEAPQGATLTNCALLLRKVKDDGSNTNVFWINSGDTKTYTFQQSDLSDGYTKLRLMFYLSTNYNSTVGTYTFKGVTFESINYFNLLSNDNIYTKEKSSGMFEVVKELYIDNLPLDNSELKVMVAQGADWQQVTIYKDNVAVSNYSSSTLIGAGLVTMLKQNNGYDAYAIVDFTKFSNSSRHYILDNKIVRDKTFSPSIANYLAPKANNPWKGKNLLAIGDSITAANVWQQKAGEVLEMNVSTHAKGGIGIIAMVDGQGDLAALTSSDVAGKDLIIIGGFYNERYGAINAPGQPSDMYPTQNTFIGRLNYAIKRIYQCLNDAGNMKCRIVMFSAHKYGKYPWNDQNAYYDGDILFDATKKSADYNSIPLVDLMHGGGINEYTWNTYQLYPTYYNTKYIPYGGVNDGNNHPFPTVADLPTTGIVSDRYATVEGVEGCYWWNGSTWAQDSTPYIWLGDQLHPNTDGYNLIGERIAGKVLELR